MLPLPESARSSTRRSGAPSPSVASPTPSTPGIPRSRSGGIGEARRISIRTARSSERINTGGAPAAITRPSFNRATRVASAAASCISFEAKITVVPDEAASCSRVYRVRRAW